MYKKKYLLYVYFMKYWIILLEMYFKDTNIKFHFW